MMRLAVLALFLLAAAPSGSGQEIEQVRIEGSLAVRSVPKDAIPSLDDPVFDRVLEAVFMRHDELVIGVAAYGEARAYSTWFMNRYEIVNDRIGDTPIAVTWCPLCYTGIVYIRRAGGRELTFANTGMVWRDNLVMYDRETGSWWSQAGGRAIRGELGGERLEMFSASMMSWGEWRRLHPDTLALSKRTHDGITGEENEAASYHEDPGLVGLSGRGRPAARGVAPKTVVLGFRIGDRAWAVVMDRLASEGVLMTENEPGIIVAAAADGSGARVFLAGRNDFERATGEDDAQRLIDRATGSRWDALTGTAISGPLAGTRLEEIPSSLSYWFAWRAFFPHTDLLVRD